MHRLKLPPMIKSTYYKSKFTAFSPDQLPDLSFWFRPGVGVTKDASDYVSVWQDQSGNNNHLVQSSGANQMKYIDSQLNGYPAIREVGGGVVTYMNLTTPFTMGNNDHETIYYVFKRVAGTNFGGFFGANLGIYHFQPYVDGNIYANQNGAYVAWYASGMVTSFNVSSVLKTATGIKLFINSSLVETEKTISWTGVTMQYLGTPDSAMSGDIIEIIGYDSKHSDIDRAKVETYLNAKYNIF